MNGEQGVYFHSWKMGVVCMLGMFGRGVVRGVWDIRNGCGAPASYSAVHQRVAKRQFGNT